MKRRLTGLASQCYATTNLLIGEDYRLTSRIRAGGLMFLAVAAGLVVVVAGTEPTGAQSEPTVRVSNLGEAADAEILFSPGQSYGQAFTTGDTDVTLEKVRTYAKNNNSSRLTNPRIPAPGVTVRSDNSGEPGSTLVTLTNPTLDLLLSTHEDFTGEVRLSANTTYWLVITKPNESGHFAFSVTESDQESSAEGWSLGNRFLSQSGSGWSESFNYNFRVAVYAGPAEPGGL